MNIISTPSTGSSCGACKDGSAEPFAFTMAFQPIVDISDQTVFAYEALVRGPAGESAYSVLSQVTEESRYAFDQNCRVKAITLASRLRAHEHGARLSVNFMPGAVYSPSACIQRTLRAARETGFPLQSLIFEITEDERVRDTAHLQDIVSEYRSHGFTLALDDFGAGYSGLDLLAELNVDVLKLDMRLVRHIHTSLRSTAIVRAVVAMCHELNVRVIAEGVETVDEFELLRDLGIVLMQGYLFARPMLEGLPAINWPVENRATFQPAPVAEASLESLFTRM
ncbi:MAG TPA: EAL domain-containing protein [Acidobacteriaceae bacterium]|jgi:EAL domain-containing protein (putative c-di-GMP-specific phosphodiesterase class I)